MKKWTDFSYIVSIPLGTINTNNGTGAGTNPFYVSIPLGTINTPEHIFPVCFIGVSIPLGTINTLPVQACSLSM